MLKNSNGTILAVYLFPELNLGDATFCSVYQPLISTPSESTTLSKNLFDNSPVSSPAVNTTPLSESQNFMPAARAFWTSM